MYPSVVCESVLYSVSPLAYLPNGAKLERPSTRELVTFRYILYHLFRVHHIHYVAGSKGGSFFLMMYK